MAKNLSLLLLSVVVCYAGTEAFFQLRLSGQRSLPLVKFWTEHKNVVLWSYDRHFNSVADYDLREETPYRQITYCCNEDGNPDLRDIRPEQVPHAVEVVFSPQATRDRDWRKLPKGSRVTLVVGDSFCFGQGVRERDRFSNRLEVALNARNSEGSPPHGFVTACYGGADVLHVSRTLENFARQVPNVERAIYAYVLNDPVQDERLRKMQAYINDFMHLRVRGRDSKLPEPERAPTPLLQWFRSQALNRKISSETIRWYHELHQGPTFQHTRDMIVGMDRFAKEGGIQFTLVILPLFHHFDHYPFRDIHETMVRFARDNDIAVVNLLEAFEGTDAEDFWVHPKDFHPNHRAHAIMADFLLERISW